MVQMSAILPDFVGTIITSGHYSFRLLKKLGSGSYGVVYLARDLATPENNPVFYAVKCLLKHPVFSEHAMMQDREISYHNTMSYYPNVVTLRCVIEEDYYVHLVMDYCSGGDLFGAIIDRQIFADKDDVIRRCFVQLLDAVQACHDNGIYHRDLKPENILFSEDRSQIYLSDFGLATDKEISNTAGCGSSFYMSPECFGSHALGVRYSNAESDIWSLGVILINMITGRNPWHIASAKHDLGYAEYLRKGTPFLQTVLPFSNEVGEIITRVFAVDPATRISIQALKEAVLNIESFFAPKDVPEYIRVADASFEASLRNAEVDNNSMDRGVHPAHRMSEMEEATTMAMPALSAARRNSLFSASIEGIITSDFVNQGSPAVEESMDAVHGVTSAASSRDESEGPITPESCPQNPTVTIPDLTLEVEGMIAHGVLPKAKSQNRLTKSVQRLVDAVHKFGMRA